MTELPFTIIVGIITSFIASLIFFWATPLVKKTSDGIVGFFSKISKNYSNSLYKNISIKNRDVVKLTFIGIIAFTIFISLFFYLKNWVKLLENTNEVLTLIHSKSPNKELDLKYFDDAIRENYDINELLKITGDVAKRKYIGFALDIMLILIAFFYFMRGSYIIRAIDYFETCLRIIRPEIDDKEYYRLEQQWALINSKDDFKKFEELLFQKVNEIVKEKASHQQSA